MIARTGIGIFGSIAWRCRWADQLLVVACRRRRGRSLLIGCGGRCHPCSTKWTLDEHLLFSRRLCRTGAAPIIKKRESRFIALALVLSYPLSCLVVFTTAQIPSVLPRYDAPLHNT